MSSSSSNARFFENLHRAITVYGRHVPTPSLQIFAVFAVVAARGPVGPAEIAEALNEPSSEITLWLQFLGDGGKRWPARYGAPPRLVSLIAHPEDSRRKIATLTPKGNQLVVEMRGTTA